MLNFVICDDNIVILDKLGKMLEAIFIEHKYDAQVSGLFTNSEDTLAFLDNNSVQVLILDINLNSSLSGLELAERIRHKDKKIYLIFTTGHLEYALMAYKYKTFDYLAKPISYERLELMVERLFEDIYETPKRFIRIGNKNFIINEDSIQFIKKDRMKIIFETYTRQYEIYSSFEQILQQLPGNFIRCHKSFVVNLNKISFIELKTNTIFFDNSKKICSIGPKYKEKLLEVFKNYECFTNDMVCLNSSKRVFN